ncbi:MAG: glycosyltransferase [Bacteroidia bacterium]
MIQKIRLHQWWKPKAGFLFALLFFATWLTNREFAFVSFLNLFFHSFVTLTAIGIFGHLLNDLGDIETDVKAGKNNSMSALTEYKRTIVIISILFIAATPWFYLPFTKVTIGLLGAELVLLVVYPLKPLRIKQYPAFGVIADALYAFAIPAVLAFYTYSVFFKLTIIPVVFTVLFLWAFTIGVRQVIYHHVSDRKNDLKSGIPNLASQFQPVVLNNFITRFIIPTELLSGLTFFLLFQDASEFVVYSVAGIYVCFFLPFFSFNLWKLFPQHVFGIFIPDKFYTYFWSLIMLAFLSYYDSWFLVVFVIMILVFTSIRSHFFIKYFFRDILFKKSKRYLSFLVNHTIYYFRKYLLMKDEKATRAEFYYEWIEERKQKSKGTIAIFNANENKYTETFVRQHKKLPFFIYYYYGVEFPIWQQGEGNLISNNEDIFNTSKTLRRWFQQDEEEFYLKTLATHLQKNNVQLILCEFGTTAVKLFRLSELTGIPMIAIFYGYDAHHHNTVREYRENYIELFQNTSLIISVSNDILNKLISLGAPKEKLVYLPCSYNTQLFQYSNHSYNNPVFLSVGRFAETKAPHLTILAFNEVQKEIPEACLVMIGKDGGGELFEACHILVKALRIEKKVSFKGILSSEQVYEEMKNAYCFVQHSVTTPIHGDKEGTPVSVIEAMASGLPVIATRHAGIAEIIEHEKTGLLVEEYDYLKMASEMLRVLNNKKMAEKIGTAAAQFIKSNQLFYENNQLLTELIDKYKLD